MKERENKDIEFSQANIITSNATHDINQIHYIFCGPIIELIIS